MKEKKKSFILYADQEKHISLMTDAQAGQLLKAIYKYAQSQEAPIITDPFVIMAFSFISEQMDRDAEKYAEICERRRLAGKKGGAPVGNSNASKTDKTTNCFQKQANQPDNDTETVNENVTENENATVNESESENENELHNMSNYASGADAPAPAPSENKTKSVFVPPDIKEINAYCTETGKPIDAQAFIDHYKSNGWKIGKNQMKDWKAAVRRWRKRDEDSGNVYSPPLVPNKPSYDISLIEQSSLKLYEGI